MDSQIVPASFNEQGQVRSLQPIPTMQLGAARYRLPIVNLNPTKPNRVKPYHSQSWPVMASQQGQPTRSSQIQPWPVMDKRPASHISSYSILPYPDMPRCGKAVQYGPAMTVVHSKFHPWTAMTSQLPWPNMASLHQPVKSGKPNI